MHWAAAQAACQKGRDEKAAKALEQHEKWADDLMVEEPARTLDKAWNATCRVLFGTELGERKEYSEWLAEYALPAARRKSHLSGKEVILAKDAYPPNASFVSADELVLNRGYSLGINQIKDIDSILEGIGEQCEYTGNRILGNSAFVESSDIVIDSQYVSRSTNIEESMYMDSSFMMRRGSKYCFGSGYGAESEFLLRTVGTFGAKRCFESQIIGYSSDMYFCHNCDGCQEMMFSYGQRHSGYRIGNLQLSREKYRQLKGKLVAELAGEIVKKKGFPSLYSLVPDRKPKGITLQLPPDKDEKDKRVIEKGFARTYQVMLKEEPSGGIDSYEGWLCRNTLKLEEATSPFGRKTYYPLKLSLFSKIPLKRIVGNFELVELGKKLRAKEKDTASLENMVGSLGDYWFLTAEIISGEIHNYMKSPIVYYASDVYGCYDATYAENVGFCTMALNAKYTYGCHRTLESQFCLKCYNSLHLNRCFELDSCSKCADSYFCHNCEAMQDAMFCFNMKGKRNVIGNTQLEKGKYAQLKESLVAQMAGEIGRTKALKRNIYNIGT